MNKEEQLNKFLDGELSESEASLLADALDSDSELAEHFKFLNENRELHLESAAEPLDEFSIEQEFLKIQKQLEPRKENKNISFPGKWLYSSIGVAAALVLSLGMIWNQSHTPIPSAVIETHQTIAEYTVPTVETDIEGASSMIFTDEQTGWTFVWIDEPQTNEENSIAG